MNAITRREWDVHECMMGDSNTTISLLGLSRENMKKWICADDKDCMTGSSLDVLKVEFGGTGHGRLDHGWWRVKRGASLAIDAL